MPDSSGMLSVFDWSATSGDGVNIAKAILKAIAGYDCPESATIIHPGDPLWITAVENRAVSIPLHTESGIVYQDSDDWETMFEDRSLDLLRQDAACEAENPDPDGYKTYVSNGGIYKDLTHACRVICKALASSGVNAQIYKRDIMHVIAADPFIIQMKVWTSFDAIIDFHATFLNHCIVRDLGMEVLVREFNRIT